MILIPKIYGPYREPYSYPNSNCDFSRKKKRKQPPLGKYIFLDSTNNLFSTVTFMDGQQVEVKYMKDDERLDCRYVMKDDHKLELVN